MLVVCSDTHRRAGHGLDGALLDAVRAADRVVHAGDFTTTDVVDAFGDAAARLDAVHGNADDAGVQDRLPVERVVGYEGARIVVTHRPEGGETGLAMRGRAQDADLVVFGHTHRPTLVETDDVTLLNPGSHADPRGNRPGYATLEREDATLQREYGTLVGTLRGLDGDVVDRFVLEPATGE